MANDEGYYGPEQITDNLARHVWASTDQSEPEPGSVVLTGGQFGTAWQRQFHDGLWHSTRRKGGPKTWEWMLTRRNLALAYDAEPRPPEQVADSTEPQQDRTPQPGFLHGADLERLL